MVTEKGPLFSMGLPFKRCYSDSSMKFPNGSRVHCVQTKHNQKCLQQSLKVLVMYRIQNTVIETFRENKTLHVRQRLSGLRSTNTINCGSYSRKSLSVFPVMFITQMNQIIHTSKIS